MFATKKITDKVVAYIDCSCVFISLRFRGKLYFGKEDKVVSFKEGKLYINKTNLEKYSIPLIIEEME